MDNKINYLPVRLRVMHKKSIILIITYLFFYSGLYSQKIIDSIKVYDYPVREGIVYKYDLNSGYGCPPLPIVTVLTYQDSLFHFQNGEIACIFNLGDCYAVVIRNLSNEYITYSNLKSTNLQEGAQIKRGDYIGKIEKGEENNLNSLDILIFNKAKELSYERCIEYIRYKMSSNKENCSDLISNPL
jgi:hypothetical protein